MSLKPGYQQTEIGVIPDDWAVKELGEIAEFTNGKPNEQNVVVNGRYLLVTLDSINIQGELKTSHKQTNLLDDSLRAGDIVTVLSDIAHGNLLGLCGVIPLDHKYVLNQRMGRLRVHSGYDPGFIRLTVNRNQNHFKMRGQGTSQRHIYRRDFDCLKIGLPNSVAEQKAIADALSDVDALIDSLEALLIKKRNIKTGVMQELLTGRTRLSGFTGDWKEVCLGDLVSQPITDGPHLTPKFYKDGVPFLSVNNIVGGKILWNDLRYISREDDMIFSVKCKPKRGDILFGKAASVGKIALVDTDIDFNVWSPLAVIRCSSSSSPQFVHFALQSSLATRQIVLLTNSSSQGNIGMTDIAQIEILMPSLKEQKAIAAVLSDIDDESEALDKRLAKTRDLKQGIAQELLTGRTRLV